MYWPIFRFDIYMLTYLYSVNFVTQGMRLRSKLEHFSVYAMDAADGVILWRHDGVEVHAEQYVKSLPQHAYKLDLTDLASKIHHGSLFASLIAT